MCADDQNEKNFTLGVHSWVEGFRKGTNFPQAEDLNGAAQALVRLQDTYQLDMPALGQGNVVPARHLLIDNEQGKQIGYIYLHLGIEQSS